jgi:tRNA G18 (ribose-2'-O)-methylase SpoU
MTNEKLMVNDKCKMINIVAILHNIRSLHNVGSMFRTADGAGISKLYLTGYTGYPPREEISKTALGADKIVSWERHGHIGKLIDSLKKEGHTIVALENKCPKGVKTQPYNKFKPPRLVAVIFGNEVKGLSENILKKADVILEIPMRGQKESLNVSVAFGVVTYQLTSKIVTFPTKSRTCRGNGKRP